MEPPHHGHGEVPVDGPGYQPPPPFVPPEASGVPLQPVYGAPSYPPPTYGQPPQGYPLQGYPPQGYPPPNYQPFPYAPPAQQAGTNGFAIASMVLGILWIYWVGSVLAIIFGFVARSQIKRSRESGDGMAIAGIVLGFVGIGALVIVLIVIATAVNNDPNFNVLLGG